MTIEQGPVDKVKLPFGLDSGNPYVDFYTDPNKHLNSPNIVHTFDIESYDFSQETYKVVVELDPRTEETHNGWNPITLEDHVELKDTVIELNPTRPDLVEGNTSYTEESISKFVLKSIVNKQAELDKEIAKGKQELEQSIRISKRARSIGFVGLIVAAGFGYNATRTFSAEQENNLSVLIAVWSGIPGVSGLLISLSERNVIKRNQKSINGDIEIIATLDRIEGEINMHGVKLV